MTLSRLSFLRHVSERTFRSFCFLLLVFISTVHASYEYLCFLETPESTSFVPCGTTSGFTLPERFEAMTCLDLEKPPTREIRCVSTVTGGVMADDEECMRFGLVKPSLVYDAIPLCHDTATLIKGVNTSSSFEATEVHATKHLEPIASALCVDAEGCTIAWRCGTSQTLCDGFDMTTGFPFIDCLSKATTVMRHVGCYMKASDGSKTLVGDEACAPVGKKPFMTTIVPACTYSWKCYLDGLPVDCADTSALRCIDTPPLSSNPGCYSGEYDRQVRCTDANHVAAHDSLCSSKKPANICTVRKDCALTYTCNGLPCTYALDDMTGFTTDNCAAEARTEYRTVGCSFKSEDYEEKTNLSDMCGPERMKPSRSRDIPKCGYSWKCYHNGQSQDCAATCGLDCVAPDPSMTLPAPYTGVYQRDVKCTDMYHNEVENTLCKGAVPFNYCQIGSDSSCYPTWRCGASKKICDITDLVSGFPYLPPCIGRHEKVLANRKVDCYVSYANGTLTRLDDIMCAGAGKKPVLTRSIRPCDRRIRCMVGEEFLPQSECQSISSQPCIHIESMNSKCYSGQYKRRVECVTATNWPVVDTWTYGCQASDRPLNECKDYSGCPATWHCRNRFISSSEWQPCTSAQDDLTGYNRAECLPTATQDSRDVACKSDFNGVNVNEDLCGDERLKPASYRTVPKCPEWTAQNHTCQWDKSSNCFAGTQEVTYFCPGNNPELCAGQKPANATVACSLSEDGCGWRYGCAPLNATDLTFLDVIGKENCTASAHIDITPGCGTEFVHRKAFCYEPTLLSVDVDGAKCASRNIEIPPTSYEYENDQLCTFQVCINANMCFILI